MRKRAIVSEMKAFQRSQLYMVQKGDFERAIALLCEAFVKDPFFQYILEGRNRTQILTKAIHSFILRLGQKYGVVYAPSSAIEGIAVWLPPGQTKITPWKVLTCGALGIVRALGFGMKNRVQFATRMIAFSSYSGKMHEKHVPSPHWYLLAIAVGEQHRGKGYASRLVRSMTEKSDQDKLPCFLETHNPRNVEIYRHLGFEVVEEGRLPGSNKSHWAMLRRPEAKS